MRPEMVLAWGKAVALGDGQGVNVGPQAHGAGRIAIAYHAHHAGLAEAPVHGMPHWVSAWAMRSEVRSSWKHSSGGGGCHAAGP